MIGTPRMQGKVGQIEDPPELRGRWTFTLWISIIGEGEAEMIQPPCHFATEEEALRELNAFVQQWADDLAKKDPRIAGLVDLQTNTLIPANKQNLH